MLHSERRTNLASHSTCQHKITALNLGGAFYSTFLTRKFTASYLLFKRVKFKTVHERVWIFILFWRSPGGDSCQLMTRKRRRGVIEKKRRDRINTSLTELKRLVPAACEKQGSAKLEKAEILQLTVDHLKMLHSKGNIRCYEHLEMVHAKCDVKW